MNAQDVEILVNKLREAERLLLTEIAEEPSSEARDSLSSAKLHIWKAIDDVAEAYRESPFSRKRAL